MMGGKPFLLKIVLLWCVIGAVLVECNRQKKDVHHMIILHEEKRPVKSHNRYKKPHHQHHRGKNRGNKPKSSEESFEDSSYEEPARYKNKTKSKRHHHKRHPYLPYSDSKWTPMASQEVLGYNHLSSVFPAAYPRGQLHFSQPIPMEITTPFSMPPNSFFSFESTLYPPLANTKTPVLEGYKPFDYSVLEPQRTLKEVTVGYELPSTTAPIPFSIVMGNSTEEIKTNEEPPSKKQRGRGTNRFRPKRKNKN